MRRQERRVMSDERVERRENLSPISLHYLQNQTKLLDSYQNLSSIPDSVAIIYHIDVT